MSRISKEVGAYLMTDIAHFSGLVASQLIRNPFELSDVVTTTTHKSLRGPRAALLFYRKEIEKQMNFAVFPQCQGGPHNHAIAAISVQLKEVMSEGFKIYSKQIILNTQTMVNELNKKGYKMATGGSDTHLILWDLRPNKLSGSKFEALCDAAHITLNKNSVHGDKSAFSPGGVRCGLPALTSRGFEEKDIVNVCDFLHRAVQISLKIQKASGNKLIDFKNALKGNSEVQKLAKEVFEFSKKFPMPGRFL